MVDVPSVPNNIPQLRAPTSGVSPGQIAQPIQEAGNMRASAFRELSDNLTKAGEEAGGIARAARVEALAKMTPEIENRVTEIQLEHKNDPEGYKKAIDAFKNTYLNGDEEKGVPGITDPVLRGPVENTIIQHGAAGYRSVLVNTDATNARNTGIAVKSQISDLSNQMEQLAFTGKSDGPEYKRMQSDLGALYGELGKDPRLGYPKERIDSELTEIISQNKTMAIAGQAIRMTDSDSPTARADAKKWLIDKIYNDPTLNLTLAQRHQAVTTAMGLMEARSAENKALIDANKAQVNTILTGLHTNQPYNPIAVNDAISQSQKIGDAESYYKLTFAKGMHDWDSTIRSLPLPQQLAGLRVLDSGRAANLAMDFFTSRGYSREQASGIVGNLIQESGLNPNAIHDQGTGIGIAGHRLERMEALKQFAAARGKPINDFQTQLEFIDQELNTTEGKAGAALRAAKTPEEAARAFVGYERPQGYTADKPEAGHGYANRVANAIALSRGDPAGNGLTGAGAAWFNEARLEQVSRTRDYLKGQASDYVDTAVKMLAKTGDVPDGMLATISDVLHETGQDDLRKKIDVALMSHYGVKELDKLPESVRRSWVVQSAPEARESPIAYQVHEHMAGQIEATAKAMQENPYTTYAARTGGVPPPQFDFGKPDTIGQVATTRAGIQASFRENDRTGPVSVFEGKEAQSFATLLTNGDPGQAAAALGSLSSLPTEIYQATLTQKPVADAVSGMLGSKDPARMSAAMQAVDKFWRDDPAGAEGAFGKSGVTKMQAWQGMRGAFSAPEIAERLNASDEPSTRKAREEAREEAEKETKSLTPSDMAYKLGTGLPIIGRLTGSTPSAPFDSIKGGELVADYRTTYSALRAYGVDADKASDLAVQRLQSTWGVSAAAGNQVMKNPPERNYPQIAGSHDWIARDLQEWVTRKAGPELSTGRRSLEMGAFAGADRNWEIAGLVSDGQTSAEIASGKPASYQVAIKKADGTLQILDSRVAFDPSSHIRENESRLEQRRQAVDFLRSGQFNTAMPQP